MKKTKNPSEMIRTGRKSREKHVHRSDDRDGRMYPGKRSRIPVRKAGFGTVEIVLIIAVLISLALLFRSAITSYATHLITSVFGDQSILSINDEGDGQP